MFRVVKAGGYQTSALAREAVYSGISLGKVAASLRQHAVSRSVVGPARPMHDVLYLDAEVVSAYARLKAGQAKQAPPTA